MVRTDSRSVYDHVITKFSGIFLPKLLRCAKKRTEHFAGSLQLAGLEIATDTVANATNIFSLATKNSGLVAKVATRF